MSWEADAYEDDTSYSIEQDDEDVEDYDEIEPPPAKKKKTSSQRAKKQAEKTAQSLKRHVLNKIEKRCYYLYLINKQ